jgi:hypothetical protein
MNGGVMNKLVRWAAVVPCVLVLTACASNGPTQGASAGAGASTGSGNAASTDSGQTAPVSDTGVGGRVSTPAGGPVAVATVTRRLVDSNAPVTQEAAVTDSEGRYFWPLSPGEWEITISASGWQSVSQRVPVIAGQRAVLDSVLQPANK